MNNLESKSSSSWDLHKVKLPNHTVLNIFTKAWEYRWGKIYSEEKFFTILSWSAEVTVEIMDEDKTNTYLPGLVFNIPANIPNVFFFPEDCEMLEWFPKDVEVEKYERFRDMKKPQVDS